MAVFIEITTDAFQENFSKKSAAAQASRRAGASRVRRPLRGLEVKEDTYAIIKVIQADGNELPLLDSGTETGSGPQFSNFIIQSVQEARMEKHQIVETFGEAYIFFFGEAPRFLDITAVLINSNDFNWEAEWWANYSQFFRGTKSVELGARTYLFYDDTIVEGYMLQAQAVKTADQPLMVQISFRLYLTNYQSISFIGDPNFPIRSTVSLPSTVPSLSDPLNGEQMNALVGETSGFDANGLAQGGFDLSSGGPLRSRFVDNFDEYTGPPPEGGPDPFDALRQQAQADIEEAADLMQALVSQLESFGVDVNAPYMMKALGLGPNFTEVQGFGVGGGSGASATATFSATAGASVSFEAEASLEGASGLSDFEQQIADEVIYQQLLEAKAQLALEANGGAFAVGSIGAKASFSAQATASASASAHAGASAQTSAFLGSPSTYFGGKFVLGGQQPGLYASASASSSVGGTSSAFAMASFEGDFDADAGASAYASASVGA